MYVMDESDFARNDILEPIKNGRHLPDDIFKFISFYENVRVSIQMSMKLVLVGPINNIPALAQIMAWCRAGDKPLSKPMIVYWRIYASFGLSEFTLVLQGRPISLRTPGIVRRTIYTA